MKIRFPVRMRVVKDLLIPGVFALMWVLFLLWYGITF